MTDQPESLDPEYEHHGGFPRYEPAEPGPGFARFVTAMRRLQDLAVSTNPDSETWEQAAEWAEELVKLLDPYQVPEGVAPAGRVASLPGMGSLLMPPWTMTKFDPDGVEMRGQFGRFYVGGNMAVHGGVIPLVFDWLCGMVVHAANRPISRTAYLKVDYRKVTPIDTPLTTRGRITETEGRKAFISGELVDEDDTVLAEVHALMVRLLPGQP
ncbi:thioesterase [Mycobacterium heckeshornense]|uniref:PaaI family thioesterase n=1 Tax=Mycobacterium heckeshornense TaxID=110505 RepID=UPI0019417D2F|nr:PaaI family thioesterase [Mycobacterium heckeshornense]BCQ10859.1 thioesterase [Mycobacterium heckeshornense]